MLCEQSRDPADGREVDAAVAHAGVDDGLGALSLPDAGGKPRVHELGRREIHAACRRGADAPERAACGCRTPFDILPAVWLSSAISVTAGLLAARLLQRVWRD